jgi:hypothetical protein
MHNCLFLVSLYPDFSFGAEDGEMQMARNLQAKCAILLRPLVYCLSGALSKSTDRRSICSQTLGKKTAFQKTAESRESICESSVPGLLNIFGLIGSAMSELRALCG